MRQSGSVLIVVLGLLAILAVVGIAFVTMSGIERNSAANFAIQSQFNLAADSAVDYVCHHLVWDLWDWDPTNRTSAGMLLNNTLNTVSYPPGSDPNLYSNEAYDYPGVLDPWLASTLTSASLPANFHYSYDDKNAPPPASPPYG
ncbi:MAG TPA: pilus assembly PilX N-terminal domain-containing protein, partial [Phycisphaerae bacterium]|nr:pilus assembly PilX N-terminal domain-containing protein [Phycisphaerae bacterium]